MRTKISPHTFKIGNMRTKKCSAFQKLMAWAQKDQDNGVSLISRPTFALNH
jgi:hypothetical protein